MRLPSYYFLRSYLALAIGILVVALALDGLLVWLSPDQSTSNAVTYRSDLALVAALLHTGAAQDGLDQTALRENFTRMKPQLEHTIGAALSLYTNDDVGNQEELLSALATHEVVSLFDSAGRELLYYRVPDSDSILALGPLTSKVDAFAYIDTLVMIAYYVLVAVILFLWVRPFYRDLSSLRRAASQFGRDDFTTRLELDARSSIRPVAQSFNKMAERIQYLVTAHRDLTNAVSHELRTPLARFKFSMEMLGKTQDPEKKASYLAAMKADVQELEELIDEMLTYAKLGEENLQFSQTTMPLDTWLNRQVQQYGSESIGITLEFSIHDQLNASEASFNPDMLARALHNILRNCLRYAKSRIVVSGELTSERAILKICDDGPGIPPEKHATVFEPFSRLDTSRDKQSGGYGLGLAIAQRVLQRHAGSIHVENNLPTGACFILQWPRLPLPDSPLPPVAA